MLYFLHSASCSVIVVCRSNYAAISSQGFHISTVKLSSDVHAQPPVVCNAAKAAQKSDGSDGIWDYILVNGKAFPGSQPTQASPIAPAVGPQTTIALLQNGIGIEDEYAAAFPNNPLLSGVVYLPVTQTAPGWERSNCWNSARILPTRRKRTMRVQRSLRR